MALIDFLKINLTQWLNLCIDVVSFMKLWNEQNLSAIESINVSANCKLRKIFLLKCNLSHKGFFYLTFFSFIKKLMIFVLESTEKPEIKIPRHLEYSQSLDQLTQVNCNYANVLYFKKALTIFFEFFLYKR